MPTIELDQDVLDAVKTRALAWVDRSPSDTLRRILGVARNSTPSPADAKHVTDEDEGAAEPEAGRARKANLGTLIAAGLLEDGQTLYLRNYSGSLVPGVEARISSPNKLRMGRLTYSMSNLAARELKKAGFTATAVRGPGHWVTADGKSVLDLWRAYSRRDG